MVEGEYTIMTATETLMNQISTLHTAIAKLQAAIDDVTGSIDLDVATWGDVARLAHLVDAVKRAELA
jgi:hypothetical protein